MDRQAFLPIVVTSGLAACRGFQPPAAHLPSEDP
jgi:hypothetical protein